MARPSGTTHYQLLARHLIQGIEEGRFPVGANLPTEQQLGQEFGLSRTTVRGALRELEARGLVSRRPRLGTRVEAQRPRAGFTMAGDSIDSLLRFTRELPFHAIGSTELVVDAASAAKHQLPLGQRFVRVVGVRGERGSPPAIFSEHFVPVLYAGAVAQLEGLRGSLPEMLAGQRGQMVHEIVQEIDVCRLGREAARALECRAGMAALRTRRWYRLQGGDLVVMSTSVSPEGRYTITSKLQRELAR